MFEGAASYGDVVVILNSDEWLRRKKGYFVQGWGTRAAIIGALKPVSLVVPVNDADGTVCDALRDVRPAFFANGGDRGAHNTPELAVCDELGIKPLWNVGGAKRDSSRAIIARAGANKRVYREWGSYEVLSAGPDWQVKLLRIDLGASTSRQKHEARTERFVQVAGKTWLSGEGDPIGLHPGATAFVPEQGWHQLQAIGTEPSLLVEIQHGRIAEDDIERKEAHR